MASVMDYVGSLAVSFFFERPVRGQSAAALSTRLEQAGRSLAATLAQKTDNAQHHALITHIIGIERWAQARLKVGLGEAAPSGEYDAFRPPKSTPWSDLLPLFQATRAESVRLVMQLPDSALSTVVRHNQWGEMTLRGWISYIEKHAALEAKKLR